MSPPPGCRGAPHGPHMRRQARRVAMTKTASRRLRQTQHQRHEIAPAHRQRAEEPIGEEGLQARSRASSRSDGLGRGRGRPSRRMDVLDRPSSSRRGAVQSRRPARGGAGRQNEIVEIETPSSGNGYRRTIQLGLTHHTRQPTEPCGT